MKCASSYSLFLLISLVTTVSAQSGKCLDLETSCVNSEGTDCRRIEEDCGRFRITPIAVRASYCNNTGKRVSITSESTAKFTGPAISPESKVLPFNTTSLANGECGEETFEATIDPCKPFFNYEINLKTEEKDCRGYYFGRREIKSRCEVESDIECTLEDGTYCEEYGGPEIVVSQQKPGSGCPAIQCILDTPESCLQDVEYKFTVYNRNGRQHPILFDLKHPKIANSKVAWKLVKPNKKHFERLEGGLSRSWTEVRRDVNTCRVIPSASINVRGNVVQLDTNDKDEDFLFCWDYREFSARRFGSDYYGNKVPFCTDLGDTIPCPNGEEDCFCTGVIV